MDNLKSSILNYEGGNFFRQRIFLSTLSGIPIRISNMHREEDEPGIKEHEASFLRLVDKITNGTKIEVNETGTSLLYIPGLLIGGKCEHDCSTERSISYYLEGIIPMAPFCKNPINVTLRGVTNDNDDISVDSIKFVTIPLLKKFGVGEGLDLKINKRGGMPDGGGEVLFTCPVCRKLRPLQFVEQGKFKRIRGTAFSVKVSSSFVNRIVNSAREILCKVVSDIYIYADQARKGQSGKSPCFGLALMVESKTGTMLSFDSCSSAKGADQPVSPEDIGRTAALGLLQEVFKGGCVDSTHQYLALLFMALGQMDVSKILVGTLSPYTIQFLKHMKDFFNLMYKIELVRDASDNGSEERFIVSCMGIGFTNLSKTSI